VIVLPSHIIFFFIIKIIAASLVFTIESNNIHYLYILFTLIERCDKCVTAHFIKGLL